jgi:hypothetical protein
MSEADDRAVQILIAEYQYVSGLIPFYRRAELIVLAATGALLSVIVAALATLEAARRTVAGRNEGPKRLDHLEERGLRQQAQRGSTRRSRALCDLLLLEHACDPGDGRSVDRVGAGWDHSGLQTVDPSRGNACRGQRDRGRALRDLDDAHP